MERDWESAQYLLEIARHRPYKIKTTNASPTQSKWKSIHQKLIELYVEECNKEPRHERLRNASHLLDKLIAREKISCLVVNLYAGNEGYSVLLKGRNGVDTETVRLPYEEAELLQYIDNEELPPVLVDILECSQINIFYSGCVVTEVRDYRRSISPSIYEAHHVLLRPSMQTLICDVNSITNDGNKWTHEDKMALESNLLLATQEPLCLEPSVTVTLVANYLQHSRQKFNVTPIKNMAKRYSQTAINRKWKFEQYAAPPNLKLHDFLSKKKDKQRNQFVNLRINKNINEAKKPPEVDLKPPESVEVESFAKCLPQNEISYDNVLDLVEKYTLESKQGNGKGYYCQLSIFLRSIDDRFVGHLYTDRDYVEGVMKGATCRFELGNRSSVDRYLHQFIEIFIQESRKTVKITHEVKGKGTSLTSVPGGQITSFPIPSTTTMQPLDQFIQPPNAIQQPDEKSNLTFSSGHDAASTNSGSLISSAQIVKTNSRQSQIPLNQGNNNPGTTLISGFFSSQLANKTALPLKTAISNINPTDSNAGTSMNSPSSNWRSQQPETVPALNLVGISAGINNLNSNGEQVSKLNNLGVSSGIAISVALVSPSQTGLITTPARATGEAATLPHNPAIAVANEVSPSTIMVASGMSPISSVVTAPGGVVSFPVALSGGTSNVSARFITSALNSPIQAHRANAVGLLQVSGAVSWPSGSGSPQAVQTSTPPPSSSDSGTAPASLTIAAVGSSIINVPSNFNQQQLHLMHQPNNPNNVTSHSSTGSNKLKRKRSSVTSPK